MSAQPCGCDREENNHHCGAWPWCAEGKAQAEAGHFVDGKNDLANCALCMRGLPAEAIVPIPRDTFGAPLAQDAVVMPDSHAMREAWTLTHGDRRSAYGTPSEVFAGYALMWTGLLLQKLRPGVVLEATDVTLMMTALKLARESNHPKRDNLVDAHGYLVLHEEIK